MFFKMAINKKEIIFIRPAVPKNLAEDFTSVQYPINLGYLASQLIKYGYKVKLLDYLVEPFNNSFFEKIVGTNKKIFCFSCFSSNINEGHRLAKKIKYFSKNSLILVGGSHASNLPEKTLKEFPFFDAVVVGESEETLIKIANNFFSNNEKEDFLNKQIIKNTSLNDLRSLDTFSFPLRTLKSNRLYNKSHVSKGFSRKFMNIAEVISSRGCVYNCIFCLSSNYKKIRLRNYKNVIAEIKYLININHVEHISFEDDIFTYNQQRTKKLCTELKKLNLTWNCNTHVNHVSKELIKIMIDSGCKKISFGVESGSQKILNLIKKGTTIQQIKKVFSWCHELKLKYIEGTFLLGSHPDETINDIEKTRTLIKEIRPDFIVIGIAAPYQGTIFSEMLNENSFILHPENYDSLVSFGTKPLWNTNCLSSKQLFKIQKDMIKYFYFHPRFFIKKLLLIKNFNDLKYFSSIALSVLKNYLFSRNRLFFNKI